MKHPVEVKRLFTKTDEEVLRQSDALFAAFRENMDCFGSRFPDLNSAFAGEWEASATTARSIAPDYAAVADQSAETKKLEALMEQGRTVFQTTMLFVQLAYPNDPDTYRLFGQSKYVAVRANQLKFPVLLRTMFAQASKEPYKTALMAKGLKEEEITVLETTAREITSQNAIQLNAKKARSLAAADRIRALNSIWEKMSMVCQCAKLVFKDDAPRYNLFLLTDNEPPKPGDSTPPAGSK